MDNSDDSYITLKLEGEESIDCLNFWEKFKVVKVDRDEFGRAMYEDDKTILRDSMGKRLDNQFHV